MSKPFVAQWGIIGCGWISSEFVQDICRPISIRSSAVSQNLVPKPGQITHAIAAVGSRSIDKAREFKEKYCPRGAIGQQEGHADFEVEPVGSYRAVVDHPNVKIVYVGTPHVNHYQDAKLVLEAGKHCLLEKPATLNAAEWNDLSRIATERGLFLMEAVWTRFNPCMLAIQKAVHAGEIGEVHAVYSDHAADEYGKASLSSRLLNPSLAGGPLMDLGPYPMVWTLMMLYHHPKNGQTPPASLGSTMLKHPDVDIDIATTFSMTFPKIPAIAQCTVNFVSMTDRQRGTRIVGDAGEIIVQGHTSRPQSFVIRRYKDPARQTQQPEDYVPDEKRDHRFEGFGLYWEADAVARCLKDELTECPQMLRKETLMVMQMFDKIRHDGGYAFQEGLEKVK